MPLGGGQVQPAGAHPRPSPITDSGALCLGFPMKTAEAKPPSARSIPAIWGSIRPLPGPSLLSGGASALCPVHPCYLGEHLTLHNRNFPGLPAVSREQAGAAVPREGPGSDWRPWGLGPGSPDLKGDGGQGPLLAGTTWEGLQAATAQNTLTFPTNPEQGLLLGARARSPRGMAGHRSLCRGRALKARLGSPRSFRRAACGWRRGLQAWLPDAWEWL